MKFIMKEFVHVKNIHKSEKSLGISMCYQFKMSDFRKVTGIGTAISTLSNTSIASDINWTIEMHL